MEVGQVPAGVGRKQAWGGGNHGPQANSSLKRKLYLGRTQDRTPEIRKDTVRNTASRSQGRAQPIRSPARNHCRPTAGSLNGLHSNDTEPQTYTLFHEENGHVNRPGRLWRSLSSQGSWPLVLE